MDPFTQRMLERARARQEKIDQKLVSSGQTPKRKPLTENITVIKSPTKSASKFNKDTVISPQKSTRESLSKVVSPKRNSQECIKTDSPAKSNRKSILKKDSMSSPQKSLNDVIVTKKEFNSQRKSGNRRNSDVSVEINIMHRDDIQIEVQVEENEVPMNLLHSSKTGNGVTIKEIEDTQNMDHRAGLRHNMKSRLDRLGNLYSDTPNLSSPIHRTEGDFTSGTPPTEKKRVEQKRPAGGKKFGRLAALADQINNWEDDLTHHTSQPPETKKKPAKHLGSDLLESSTVDVSIHSINDINKVLSGTAKATSYKSKVNSQTFTKSSSESQQLNKKIVAELEHDGYRRVSASQSRLVYDFTSANIADPVRQEPKREPPTLSAAAAPNMAAVVASAVTKPPTIAKKPSIKKYKAPTPPVQTDDDENSESDKDKENNEVPVNDSEDCVQTKLVPTPPAQGSPAARRLAPKLNGNPDRGSVLSKAAMFEAGSPRAKEKDPAEMSLRERKALFEKNKGTAIIPKAPFGLAPSAKTLHGDNNKADRPVKPIVQAVKSVEKTDSDISTSRSNSKDSLQEDNISQSSVGGGIKGKLAALFNKEQTISEATIANKFKQERDKEMEMLQNRFQYKPKPNEPASHPESDDDQSDHESSEKAPLMGSCTSLFQANKKPEIIANIPKTEKKQEASKDEVEDDKVVSQPVKRRSSQDSPVVLSVLDDVKRIKVNSNKKEPQTNGAIVQQPTIYPHLSDIETDNSHNHDEYSDCGGSSDEQVKVNLNKSENWADTSFGREVMNVVKKNNTSYKKAVRESDSESGESACDSELDDMLDEALNEEAEGPTPPKLNKATLSSNSFVYEQKKFKSPLKTAPAPATPRPDRGNELVHSVSFYRRAQNATTLSTPIRQIRHASPEPPPSRDEPTVNVTTVRRRIKELQAEISKQQTVMSQASQALNLCAATIEFSGSPEQAEGERLLLLASHRRQACLHEVQRLQVEGAGEAAEAGMATLHIQALRVNLTRDYIRKLNADGAVGHHAVCLLKCRDRVLATGMQLTSPKSNVLHFPDEIRMDGLTSDFKVTVEVYLLQASKEVLPHDVKYHINTKKPNSKLLTPKSKVSELKTPRVQSPAGPMSVRSPQFQPHGYCIFALPQANRKSFTLNKVPHGSPLEGTLTLDITARVLVNPPESHAGFLTAFSDVSGLGAWHRRWFQVDSPTVLYWKYPDDVHKKLPMGDIDLKSVVSEKVVKAPRDLCARPNTLYFESSIPAGFVVPDNGSLVYDRKPDGTVVRRHLLAADTVKDRDIWLDCLNKALEYVRCSPQDDSDSI